METHADAVFFSAGVVGLVNKSLVSGLISQYAQVVLWFCRTGLLPETSGTAAPPLS